MKKLLFILFTLILCVYCSSPDRESTNNDVKISIKVSPENLVFEHNGGVRQITVISESEWHLENSHDWCMLSKTSGKGDSQLTISVSPTTESSDRFATLHFIDKNNNQFNVEITQYGKTSTDYIDMKFGNEGVDVQFDKDSGIVKINYGNTTPPQIKKGKTIVLPDSYDYQIRIIEDVSRSGSNVTLNTTAGNMSNLFRNIEFTLTSNSSTVDASYKHRVYEPVKIFGHTNNGRVILFDRGNKTRESDNIPPLNCPIWELSYNADGLEIFNNEYGILTLDKCNYEIKMDGVFTFRFGETSRDFKLIGNPESFTAELVGSFDANLHAKYNWSYGDSLEEDIVLETSILKKTFLFYVSGVPVPITIDTHMGKRTEIITSANLEVTAGISINSEARLGIKFENDEITPIQSFESETTPKLPTFTGNGFLNTKCAYFPSVNIILYNFIGPRIEPMVYLKEELEVNANGTWNEVPYIAWKSKLSSGVDARLGLNIDFLFYDDYEWESEIFNIKHQLLVESPVRTEIIKPKTGSITYVGEPIDCEIEIQSYNYTNQSYFPCPNVFSSFASYKEENLTKTWDISDSDGKVRVTFTNTYDDYSLAVRCGGLTPKKMTLYPITEDPKDLRRRIVWE